MHIPDGYLSPQTCATAGAAMVPVWSTAARRVRSALSDRRASMLALAAAYSFVVMMINVPVPGGTTAHAVGAVLIAIILGPSAAIVAVTVALVLQALFFGDGGVLALTVNAFNMAFVMPMVGWCVYRALATDDRRRALAAGVGAYVGLNVGALAAAFELGLQPHGYSPYHLAQTIPAMMIAHLTIAGGVEAALTYGVVRYLQRAHAHVLQRIEPRPRTAVAGLSALAVLAPVGLLAGGGAFAEAPRGVTHSLFIGYGIVVYAAVAAIGATALVATRLRRRGA